MEEKEKAELKRKIETISKIVDRAAEMKMLQFDKTSLFMDLQNVDEKIGLRLDDLLAASDQGFAHDIFGIQNNFNRKTLEMDNFFLPRFSSHKEA